VPCTTPIQSPQSNGMAEAFVKTIKRDYARVSSKPDAASVLRQLDFLVRALQHSASAQGAGLPFAIRVQETPRGADDRERGRRWASTA
jgi:hypothetical protein